MVAQLITYKYFVVVMYVFPIQEMKRQAGVDVNEEEEEEMDYNEEEDNGSSADNLQVFCCSATEYQKMKNISTDDGPPHVRYISGFA